MSALFFLSLLPPAGRDNCGRWFSIRKRRKKRSRGGRCLKGSNRWTGRDHRRAAELTPNRLNQGFSRTFVNSPSDLGLGAWGETDGRKKVEEGGGAKEGRGGAGEALSEEKKRQRVQSGVLGRGDGWVYATVQLWWQIGPVVFTDSQKGAGEILGAPLVCGVVATADN